MKKSRKPLVSVITPVYNASRYLRRCMDSLLRQTYGSIEVIAVNDCSTDDSGDILACYAGQDSRVKVITNSINKGAPGSRGAAMKVVRGEYVIEVDADDWLEDNAIEQAVRCLMGDDAVDIAVLQLMIHGIKGDKELRAVPCAVPRTMTGIEACYWSLDWTISGIFVARRSVFEGTPYTADCGVYGDENTTHLQYLRARKVVLTDAVHHFTMNEASVTHAVNIRRFDILEGRQTFRQQLIAEHVDKRLLSKQALMMWRDYIGVAWLFACHRQEFTEDEQRAVCHRLKRAYSVFNISMLPLSTVLKPGYMLLPSFWMFYAQMRIKKLLTR